MEEKLDDFDIAQLIYEDAMENDFGIGDLDKYSMSIEELEIQVSQESQDKFYKRFERQACYMGNNIYSITGLFSTSTRELFLMFCLQQEDVEMEDFSRKMATIRRNKEDKELPIL